MNARIFIISLLILSVFAVSIALAEESDNESLNISALNSTLIAQEEIQDSINAVNSVIAPQHRKIGFIEGWKGNGWVTNEDQGFLLNGFWIKRTYILNNNSSNNTKVISYGMLHIGKKNYRLIKKTNSETNRSIEFYLVPPIRKRIIPEEAQRFALGTFSLTVIKKYPLLTTWKGKIEFTNNSKRSGDVEFGTTKFTMKPLPKKLGLIKKKKVKDKEYTDKKEITKQTSNKKIVQRKRPFWRKLLFWKRF